MIPSWYPTKENPISGVFFREQALVLGNEIDLLVAFVEFDRLRLRSFVKKVILGKPVAPHEGTHDFLEPPAVLRVQGFGLRLGREDGCWFSSFLHGLISGLNECIEKRTYQKAWEVATARMGGAPDLIYAMTAQVNAIQAQKLGESVRAPVVIAEHVPFSIESLPRAKRDGFRRAVEKADAVLSISHDKTRQILMGNIDCDPLYVGNMVDERVFVISRHRKEHIFTILTVASYNFYKDYKTFFRSMVRLKETCTKPFRILIAGFAPNVARGMWAEGEDKFLKAFESYDLADITALKPYVPRSEMPALYAEADGFVMTSIQEGMPVSVLEAMACGLPVFSTRCGGVEDVVDEKCGRLRPVRDYEGLASDVRSCIEGETKYNPEYIRASVVGRFGVEAFSRRMIGIFKSCIAGNKSAGVP